MLLRLVAVDNSIPPRSFPDTVLPVVLGRSPIAGCCITDRWISRHHCQIALEAGNVVVRDLDSKHGTLVNGESIRRHELRSGDHLTVGLTTLRVQLLGDDAACDDSSHFADAMGFEHAAVKPAAL